MMRELKEPSEAAAAGLFAHAAAQIPMMRELKVSRINSIVSRRRSCSPNPYDEGTERRSAGFVVGVREPAAAQIPMMRELKVPHRYFTL